MESKHRRPTAALALGLSAVTFSAFNLTFAPPSDGAQGSAGGGRGGPPPARPVGTPPAKATGTPPIRPVGTPRAQPTGTPPAQCTPLPRPTARPNPTARPTVTPTSGGSYPQATPTPPSSTSSPEVRFLEDALDRTLTTTEKTAVDAAAKTRNAAIETAQTTARTEVAAIFDLSAADLNTKIQAYLRLHPAAKNDPLPLLLPGVLGRSLTDAESAALRVALSKRDASIQAAITAYRTTVAAALGLTLEQLNAKIQAHLQSHGIR